MLMLNDGRSELWQWDTGRKLTVDADCSQVHFSNKIFGRSIDVNVVDGVAIIPDVLLQTDKDLNVWAFVGTAENGYTKISKTFKVNRRNKPADYVFTPPDQTSLEEIKERIDALEEKQDPDAIKNAVEDYLEHNPVEVPVQSVNGQTGAVNLTASDVGAVPAPGTATVGQVVKVSAVDATGKPTAWEAVDFPSVPGTLPNPKALTFTGAVIGSYDGSEPMNVEIPSGSSGESQWKLLASIELDEDVQSIHLTSDDSGNPFSCKEFVVQIAAVIRSSVSSIKFAKTNYRYDVPDIATSTVIMQLNALGNTSAARYYVFRRTMEAGLNRTVFVDSNKNIFEEKIGAVANGVYDDGTVFDTTLYDTAISDLLVYATNGFLTGDKIKIYGR